MPNFTFRAPRLIRFGAGVSDEVGTTMKELAGTHVLIVTSHGMPARPKFERFCKSLKQNGCTVSVFNGVSADPPISEAETCLEFLRRHGCDLVVGVGGGSVMDVAKVVAMRATNPGSIHDYFGIGKVREKGLPTILVPTTSGSGSEVSPDAVLLDPDTGTKKAVKDYELIATATFVDPEFALCMGPELAAISGMDALTHAVEAYVSAGASTMTDLCAIKAIELIVQNLRVSVRQKDHWQPAREAMALSSTVAGLAFGNAGTAAAHACAYPLSGMFGIAHGKAAGMMLPYVTEFNLGSTRKYDDIARILGDDIPHALVRLLDDIGLPTRLSQLGIPESAIPEMAELTLLDSRHLSVNPRKVDLHDLEAIYEKAY